MKKIFIFIMLVSFYLSLVSCVYAGYVLPYPSYMPGNKLYRISRYIDEAKGYWYFGNIAQIKYHLGLSDKYLVEAKTLFEYKQYLLASNALSRSDAQFSKLSAYMQAAAGEGMDTKQLSQTLAEAANKHMEVLTYCKSQVPSQFVWVPEKVQSTQLNLHEMLDTSLDLRKNVIDRISSL